MLDQARKESDVFGGGLDKSATSNEDSTTTTVTTASTASTASKEEEEEEEEDENDSESESEDPKIAATQETLETAWYPF